MHDVTAPFEKIMETATAARNSSLRDVMTAIKTLIYTWNLKTDRIEWSGNFSELLPGLHASEVDSGARYSNCMRDDQRMDRHRVVFSGEAASAQGRFYTCRYLLKLGDEQTQWVQDEGRWFGDEQGNPAFCYGSLRFIDDPVDEAGNIIIENSQDALTGLVGKSEIHKLIDNTLSNAITDRTSMGLIFASIENLRLINDVYGPQVGDEIIQTIAQRLSDKLRAADSIGRYGGNKFAIVLSNCEESELPVAAARYYQATAEEAVVTTNGAVSAFVTFGGITAPKHARTAEAAVNGARAALEQAVTSGRRGFVPYLPSPALQRQRKENLATSELLMRCLNEDRMELVFQPVVEAESRNVAYCEALVRLLGEGGALQTAGDVISLAERLDLVRMLDQQVLELVKRELTDYPNARMAVNVSAKSLIDPIWQSQLADFLAEMPGTYEKVTLEITESAILNNLDEAIEFLKMLKDNGCSVAIDDFGSGYTSFAKLKQLPVDTVKIDGAFVRQMRDDPEDIIFPKVLAELAKSLGLKTVAEWVETEEQASRLKEFGIDYLQGNLMGAASQLPPWRMSKESAA